MIRQIFLISMLLIMGSLNCYLSADPPKVELDSDRPPLFSQVHWKEVPLPNASNQPGKFLIDKVLHYDNFRVEGVQEKKEGYIIGNGGHQWKTTFKCGKDTATIKSLRTRLSTYLNDELPKKGWEAEATLSGIKLMPVSGDGEESVVYGYLKLAGNNLRTIQIQEGFNLESDSCTCSLWITDPLPYQKAKAIRIDEKGTPVPDPVWWKIPPSSKQKEQP